MRGLVIATALILISPALISCGIKKSHFSDAQVIKKDQHVHYEGTDSQGEFNDHQIFEDPMNDEYEVGAVISNKLSPSKAIIDNGALNRIDIVIVGDGYTSSELNIYALDAGAIAEEFFNQKPLSDYKSYFNVHRVDVVSQQSGVDNDTARNISRNTALDMSYWCSGLERLLCGNMQKIKQYAANARKVDQILAIANSAKHGGAGYWNDGVGTLAGRNPSSVETAIHEFAHIFGKLGDEYDYQGANSEECLKKANGSKWNISEMLSGKTKWYRWFDLSHVGAFKGTCYTGSNYRPTANSKMRTLGAPFYEVNSEQLIFEIYKKVRPIDSATPTGKYARNRILTVKPISDSLDVRWYLNDKEIINAAQKTSLSVASVVTSGQHIIKVIVTDKTKQVRDEAQRRALMTESRSWTIE